MARAEMAVLAWKPARHPPQLRLIVAQPAAKWAPTGIPCVGCLPVRVRSSRQPATRWSHVPRTPIARKHPSDLRLIPYAAPPSERKPTIRIRHACTVSLVFGVVCPADTADSGWAMSSSDVRSAWRARNQATTPPRNIAAAPM